MSSSSATPGLRSSQSRTHQALQPLRSEDVDGAWALQYVAPSGFSRNAPAPPRRTISASATLDGSEAANHGAATPSLGQSLGTTANFSVPPESLAASFVNAGAPVSLLDRFLEQQEAQFAASLSTKDVRQRERMLMSEWKRTRRVLIEPKRGCCKDAKWRWLLIRSYVLQKDFISAYVPIRVDTGVKKWLKLTKRRGVKPAVPPPIPLADATLEASLDDLTSYKQELAEYFSTEWEPPIEKVSVEKRRRQQLSVRRRKELLGTLADRLPQLATEDVDVLRGVLHGSHIALDSKEPPGSLGAGDDDDRERSPESVLRSSPTLGRAESVHSNNARHSSPHLRKAARVAQASKVRPTIDEALRREIELAAEHLNEASRLDDDERENLHGSEKWCRTKAFGARVLEGLYVSKPVLPLDRHPGIRGFSSPPKPRRATSPEETADNDNGSPERPPPRSKKSVARRSVSKSPDTQGAPAGRLSSAVVDYSFMDLNGLHELLHELPRNARTEHVERNMESTTAVPGTLPPQEQPHASKVEEQPSAAGLRFSAGPQELRSVVARGKSYIFSSHDSRAPTDPQKRATFEDSVVTGLGQVSPVLRSGDRDGGEHIPKSSASLFCHPQLSELLCCPCRVFPCKILKLNDNSLTNLFPEEEQEQEAQLHRLRDLGPQGGGSSLPMPNLFSHLSFVISRRITNIDNLTVLDLSNNLLKVFPKAVANLPNLRSLHLHGNRIASFVPLFEAVHLPPASVGVADTRGDNFVGCVDEKSLPPSQRHPLHRRLARREWATCATPGKRSSGIGNRKRHLLREQVAYDIRSMPALQRNLVEITLHGNPLSKTHLDIYKRNVFVAFPFLRRLDFSDVIEQDRADAFSREELRQLRSIHEELQVSQYHRGTCDVTELSAMMLTELDGESPIPFVREEVTTLRSSGQRRSLRPSSSQQAPRVAVSQQRGTRAHSSMQRRKEAPGRR